MDAEPQAAQRLASDAPIGERGEDLFGRDRIARRVAAEAVTAPADAGFVIALTGPWGSGKTSLGNLVQQHLDEPKVVTLTFNPWLVSGVEDVVGRFLGELAAVLGRQDGKLQQVAGKVARYAGALSSVASVAPAIGPQLAAAIRGLGQLAAASGEIPSLHERRAELVEALEGFEGRIVVFLDDIDRLVDEEIREIVRLVKLVGDLPRLTYLLAFDRERVEQALGAPETDPVRRRERGRAYLEKIVQSRHDVPPLRAGTIARFLEEQITAALAPYPDRHLHEEDWLNMLGLALRDMVATPRDAKRVANALPAAIEVIGDEMALIDLIGLEALSVLEPDVHAGLAAMSDVLLGDVFRFLGDPGRRREEDQRRVEGLLVGARAPDATRALLGQLFPRAADALQVGVRGRREDTAERRERRASEPDVLFTYLHATLDDDALATAEVERALELLLGEPEALAQALEGHSAKGLATLLDRLTDYANRFQPQHAVSAAAALMPLESRLGDDGQGMWSVRQLASLLLLSEPDREKRATMVEELFEIASDLSQRARVISWFGTHPESEHRDPDAEMVDEEATRGLEYDLRRRVAEAPAGALAEETKVDELLLALLRSDEEAGRAAVIDKVSDDDRLLHALLRACSTYLSSHVAGQAVVRRTVRVRWTRLSKLLGEEELRRRVIDLDSRVDRATLDPEAVAALERAVAIARDEVERDPDIE